MAVFSTVRYTFFPLSGRLSSSTLSCDTVWGAPMLVCCRKIHCGKVILLQPIIVLKNTCFLSHASPDRLLQKVFQQINPQTFERTWGYEVCGLLLRHKGRGAAVYPPGLYQLNSKDYSIAVHSISPVACQHHGQHQTGAAFPSGPPIRFLLPSECFETEIPREGIRSSFLCTVLTESKITDKNCLRCCSAAVFVGWDGKVAEHLLWPYHIECLALRIY